MMDEKSYRQATVRNQVNITPTGKEKALKTSQSIDKNPQRSLTAWNYSDIMQTVALRTPIGASLDHFNQPLSQLMVSLSSDEETGGIDGLLGWGSSKEYAPYDVVTRGITGVAAGTAINDLVQGAVDTSTSAPPPPPGQTRGTSELRTIWGPTCSSGSQLATVALWSNGATISVRRETVPLWEMVNTIMRKYNYALRKGVTGAFNCRKITGGSGLSLHSFGIAVDFNWDTNPYGPNLVTDMPGAMVSEILRIQTKRSRLTALRWGGHYKNNKDAMHYEVVVTPAELAEGLHLPGQAPVGGVDKGVE